MIRIGELVKKDKNPLMNVSMGYEMVVNELSSTKLTSPEKELLACLVISQTEKQYKNYLIKVMLELGKTNAQKLVKDWQNGDLTIGKSRLDFILSEDEKKIISGRDIESHLEELEKDYPSLFNDGFSNVFYPTKKLGMLHLRRLIRQCLSLTGGLGEFEKLVVYFVMSQLLISWESSCIHLGLMLLNDWEIKDISEWFFKVWPIYYET